MPDHLGAPHEIVNAANQRVWLWDHDPFGNGAPVAAAGFSHDLRFPGQIYDSETRLHNNGFRDYSPTLGRYVESDPIGLEGGINTYAYAGNDPVNAIDPLGLDPNKCSLSCYQTGGSVVLGVGGALIGAFGGAAIGGGEGFALSAPTGPGAIVGTAGGAVAGALGGALAGARFGVNAGAAAGEALYNLNWFSDNGGPSREAQKSIRSLERQIAAHERKLEAFRTNPTVRPGMENLPAELIEMQQQRRIRHLETEIQTFKNNIKKILNGGL
nr:RHS repeat-associated core domain-containing protein [Methylosinus sp. Sm6]